MTLTLDIYVASRHREIEFDEFLDHRGCPEADHALEVALASGYRVEFPVAGPEEGQLSDPIMKR